MPKTLQIRRDTAANWTSNNPTLASGEFGYETNTGKFKLGDGSTAWVALSYQGGGGTSDHAALTHLAYADAGHTGFEPTVTKGNLSAGSTKITIGGTGAGALIGAGATVDVNQSNVDHNSLLNYDAYRHRILAEPTSRTINFDSSMTSAQIQALIDAVGKYILPGVTITFHFADGTYTLDTALSFDGFFGSGFVWITGNMGEAGALSTAQAVHLDFSASDVDGISIANCGVLVYVMHIKVSVNTSTTSWRRAISGSTGKFVGVLYCYLNCSSDTYGYGFLASMNAASMCISTYVTKGYYGIYNSWGSCYASDNLYSGTRPKYGMGCEQCGRIGKAGNVITGSVANEFTASAGTISA